MPKTPAWTDNQHTSKACTKCGKVIPLSKFYTTGKKVDGTPKYQSWCRGCISEKQRSYHKRMWGPAALQHTAYKRTKTVRAYLSYLRGKAVRRSQGEVLSLDALETLWYAQKGYCALTGWPMTMELAAGVVPTNCSIDRVNSELGYEIGNVQLVCRAANIAKSDLPVSEFIKLCRAVVENANG